MSRQDYRIWAFKTGLQSAILLLVFAALASCMNIDVETGFLVDEDIHGQIIDQSRDLFPEIDPLFINDEIKQLLAERIDPDDSDEFKVKKLQDILYTEEFLNIQYSDVKTHTALETFYGGEGNCLSVMNLYVAMARHVDVDANFQTVDVQPSWDRRGDLLVLSQHINATGRFAATLRYVVDFTPEIALQQLTSEIITDQDARALYFNNLGVEALIGGDLDQALVYFKNALFLDTDLSISWNNIGATYNRLGNKEFALYSYQMAFDSDNTNATAINNLAKYFRDSGDLRQARIYEDAIERFNQQNPYYHFAQGAVAFRDGDFRNARNSFRRALDIKDQEPDFYIALARAYIELGDLEEANRLNESAKALVAQNQEIYRPSSDRLRLIDSTRTILRDSSAGLSIILSN